MHMKEVPLIKTWIPILTNKIEHYKTLTLSAYSMFNGTKVKLLTFFAHLKGPSPNPSFGSAYTIVFPFC